ncbi:MAG TPA: amidohydrolase family protein [bacterium]|nr:amidohydrolase family protein [bacterium]
MAASTSIIKAGRLIDGTGSDARRDVAVVVEGARIAEVRPASQLGTVGDRVAVYEHPDLTLMPGLIDTHDHIAHFGHDLRRRFNTPQSLAVLQVGRWATETLLAGITSFRDAAGADLGLKMAIDQGIIAGPRLFISLVIITQTGGHGDLIQPCGLTSDFPRLPGVPDGIADGPDECRKKVREVLRLGADWIKIATTGGVGNPRGGPAIRQFTLEELRAMVDEAHAAGKGVMVHAHGGDGLRLCLEAQVDSIEHAAVAEEADIARMARQGIWLVPTLSVTQRMKEHLDADPQSLPAYVAAKLPLVFDTQRRNFKYALEHGVKIAMGTDAGALGHGENGKELVYMVQAGMTPMQAVVASTKSAAELLGLQDALGTVEAGKLADLILVDGDPLADISVVAEPARIKLVMKDGIVYKSPRQAAPGLSHRRM